MMRGKVLVAGIRDTSVQFEVVEVQRLLSPLRVGRSKEPTCHLVFVECCGLWLVCEGLPLGVRPEKKEVQVTVVIVRENGEIAPRRVQLSIREKLLNERVVVGILKLVLRVVERESHAHKLLHLPHLAGVSISNEPTKLIYRGEATVPKHLHYI